MAMNHIRFPPGMSLIGFFHQFGTKAQCEAALEHVRWLANLRCPRCGGSAHFVPQARARKISEYSTCDRQTSSIAGALFEGSKLAPTVWLLGVFLLSQAKTGRSALALALALKRDMGDGYRRAWFLHHKRLQTMVDREGGYGLCGAVQVDDALLGDITYRSDRCFNFQALPNRRPVVAVASDSRPEPWTRMAESHC